MQSGIKDNYLRGKIAEFLHNKIKPGASLSFVSAYFTIFAYHLLREKLDSISGLKFLFGEPRFIENIDPERSDRKSFLINEDQIQLNAFLEQKKIARDCAEWIQKKCEIKSIKNANFLHGKLYHISSNGVSDAILGSSNFTAHGLGFTETPNIELNLEVDSRRDREDLQHWFNQIWHDENLVTDVKDQVLQYLAQVYRENSPQFIYYQTLFYIFKDFLRARQLEQEATEKSQLTESQIWRALFDFQKDGVTAAINKLNVHHGCIIADSVGLGKTYEALAIIKHFETRNHRVLVLCPKKLRENWTIYQSVNVSRLNPFENDRFGFTVLCHTDLSRDRGKSGDTNIAEISWGGFDLVVIDESHHFRNNTKGRRDEEGHLIRKSRYERLLEDIIRSGAKTKVLLLSATPVNNSLADLHNQIRIIAENDDHAFAESLNIPSLKETIQQAQNVFTRWADPKKNPQRNTRDLMNRLGSAFFKLLDELTIARSRRHIQNYYAAEIDRIGKFPTRLAPRSIFPQIDRKGRFLSWEKINEEISGYALSLFNPSRYVQDEFRSLYAEKSQTSGVAQFTQEDRENYLIGMIKVNFLKRLESSVKSFEITLDRTINKIDRLIEKIEKFRVRQQENPEIFFADFDPAALDDDELADALQVGKKLTFSLAHLKIDEWLEALQKDKDQLLTLYNAAKTVAPADDAKLSELKCLIREKAQNPTTNRDGKTNKKILVFTAFADTAGYLYQNLADEARNFGCHIALITGATPNQTTLGGTAFHEILTNFSPNSRQRAQLPHLPQNAEIDILIATDCVSEGVNLQDCDRLVNYDIHWNPVRLIQRFGRIDRIGSRNLAVQMINFWPTPKLDQYLNLKHRVESRMALVDITATGDDAILNAAEMSDLIADDLNFRDKQLLRFKDEVLDLEDFSESVTLSEFTLDDFRLELVRFIEANRQLLENAPTGLYAVVPAPDDAFAHLAKNTKFHLTIEPGVIFCLRQKNHVAAAQQVNPIAPWFLIYIQDDLTLRYGFSQPKSILEIFRHLCAGRPAAWDELCRIFNTETQNGADMQKYSHLLQKAVKVSAENFNQRNIQNMLTSRGGRLVEAAQQIRELADFDLVTWLVIK